MDDGDARTFAVGEPVERRDRRAHARELGAVRDDESDRGPGAVHRFCKSRECFTLAQILVGDVGKRGDRGGTGELATGVTTHPIGDDEQASGGVAGILVALAHDSDIGARGVAECEAHGHRLSWRVVRPIRSGTPGGRTVGEVMRVRSIQVPLVEPRSSTIQPSSPG